jgi:menaquinone-dependent protoporphyrinogen oxidase
MMNVLIIYGTIEGQTRKIATFMADRVRDQGNEVSLVDSTDMPTNLDVGIFDAVIAAGSVHNGHHQGGLLEFVRRHVKGLQALPTAFVSVSLSMASDEAQDRLDAAACADQFLDVAGWKPSVTHLVAGALRYTQYDFFKGWMLKMIAGAKGASTDTSKDHEFTDWRDLETFVDAFLVQIADHHGNGNSEKHKFGEGEAALSTADQSTSES